MSKKRRNRKVKSHTTGTNKVISSAPEFYDSKRNRHDFYSENNRVNQYVLARQK